MLQGLQGASGQRLQYRANTVSQIKQKYDGKRHLVAAEGVDLLPYAILKQLKVIRTQVRDGTVGLFAEHLRVNHDLLHVDAKRMFCGRRALGEGQRAEKKQYRS